MYVYVSSAYINVRVFQAGDVLVVMCTDVGWSPYFPLIAGLVTEIGGLLSHGKHSRHMYMTQIHYTFSCVSLFLQYSSKSLMTSYHEHKLLGPIPTHCGGYSKLLFVA